MEDITGDTDALARAAGIVDLDALELVRDRVRAVVEAEQALRLAVAERNQALRAAAVANPDCPANALARYVGLGPSLVREALRGCGQAPARQATRPRG